MLALAAALAFQNSALPEKAIVSYSGIPTITGPNVSVQFHNVTITLNKATAEVSSTTLVKNNGGPGQVQISIPEFQSDPASQPFNITATWANAPLQLKRVEMMGIPENRNPSAKFTAPANLLNLGSYALRIHYTVPLGKCGFDHKQLLAAYDLNSPAPMDTLMVTYTYGKGVVFHLPSAEPDLGWQIGLKGSFLKKTNYDGNAGLSYLAFYSGGFGG